MNILCEKLVDIYSLEAHPAEPPSRIRDTTELQANMLKFGLLEPLLVARDEKRIFSGHRRWTGGKALDRAGHKGWKEIAVKVLDVDPDAAEGLDLLLSGNNQSEMSTLEILHVLQNYEAKGIPLRIAAERVGIGANKTGLLVKLAAAPEEVRQAVDDFERSDGDHGVSLSAYKEMATLPPDKQIEIVSKGRQTAGQVRDARKKHVAETTAERIIESEDDFESVLAFCSQVKDLLGKVYWFCGNGLDGTAKAEIKLALSPALQILRQLKEVL